MIILYVQIKKFFSDIRTDAKEETYTKINNQIIAIKTLYCSPIDLNGIVVMLQCL